MRKTFKMDILTIQPSQLYISKLKLEKVQQQKIDHLQYEPIPIKKLNNQVIYTDGHTRAFVLYQMGVKHIACYWDEDELDDLIYQRCVEWCLEAKIKHIGHLQTRLLEHKDYEVLWYERCREIKKTT